VRRVLFIILGLLLALLLIIPLGGYLFLRRSLPVTNGTVRLAGPQAPIDVVRDAHGVPYIYAQNDLDAYFALGYVHAQDRLWQMEVQRRIGAGRLSEILGEATIQTDQFLRTLGTYRAAEQDWTGLSPQAQQVVESYIAGINAFLAANPPLPVEFTVLGFKPDPWQPADVMVWAKMMAWNLGGDYEEEIIRSQVIQRVGEVRARELLPGYPDSGPFIIPDWPAAGAELIDLATELRQRFGLGGLDIGSNNWVVSGSRTTTGKPLLANDPHLAAQIPAIWYLASLQGGNLNAVGATLPGAPAIILGHNERIAWGATNLGPDVQDLFIERVNPANPNEVEVNGSWQPLTVVSETIRVKGEDEPIYWAARSSRHGPLISDVLGDPGTTLALRWTALEGSDSTMEAFLGLQYAQNWEDFRSALRSYIVPSQNLVYADVDGNIGYYGPGRIPIRAKGEGYVPVPGWNDEYEWKGYIPFDDLPHEYNPARGYVVTANNQVVPDDYPYFLASSWAAPYRAARIEQMITAKDKLSPEDMATIQGDQLSLQSRQLLPYLLETPAETPEQTKAIDILRSWDGVAAQDSAAPAIYAAWLVHLQPAIFADDLGSALFEDFGAGFHPTYLATTLANNNSPWCDDVLTPMDEDCRTTQQRALADALEDLTERMGSENIDTWQWGKIHQTLFPHTPFDEVDMLKGFFSRQIANGGDGATVNVAPFSAANPYDQRHLPSYRHIVDLSNLGNSQFIQTTGQSGNVMSSHYDDLIPVWQQVQYLPMHFAREAVQGTGTLRLEPAQ
jgi:penicillin amidase